MSRYLFVLIAVNWTVNSNAYIFYKFFYRIALFDTLRIYVYNMVRKTFISETDIATYGLRHPSFLTLNSTLKCEEA